MIFGRPCVSGMSVVIAPNGVVGQRTSSVDNRTYRGAFSGSSGE